MGVAYNTSIIRNGLSFQVDFANIKSYPGFGTKAFNLNKTGDFTIFFSPPVTDGIVSFNGLNPGSYMFENSGLGNHGTRSFTYQLLCNPKTSTSIDSPTEARIYEHSGFPDTYHILRIEHNNGNPRFHFFGRDLTQTVTFSVTSPNGSAVLNQWYLLTTILDRENGKNILYVNTTRYEGIFNASLGSIGDNDSLRFPSSYAEIEMDLSCVIGYTRALTDFEVKRNFEAVRGRFGL